MLTDEGDLIGSGYASHGGLGTGIAQTVGEPSFVTDFKEKGIKIVDIACGMFHTLYLDSNKTVYASGRAQEGALGPNIKVKQLAPIQIMTDVDRILPSHRSRISMFLKGNTVIQYGSKEEDKGRKVEFEWILDKYHANQLRTSFVGGLYSVLVFDENDSLKYLVEIMNRQKFLDAILD